MNSQKKILYVDDEETNLKVFELSFCRKFSVLTAGSGSDGLELLKKDPEIAVVISDMRMPEMNGVEFIRIAKNQYPENSYFILTAFEVDNEITTALKQGIICNHLQKPFNRRELEGIMNNLLV